jgi:hypothetical protein
VAIKPDISFANNINMDIILKIRNNYKKAKNVFYCSFIKTINIIENSSGAQNTYKQLVLSYYRNKMRIPHDERNTVSQPKQRI